MKRKLLGCALVLSTAAMQLAAAEAKLKADRDSDGVSVSTKVSTDDPEARTRPYAFKGTDLIGLEVRDLKDQKIGEISDFVVDVGANRAVYAVVAAGGFLGVGGKQLAVPPGSFVVTNREDLLLWNADRELLRNAPAFDRHNWTAMADADWGRDVYAHYGQTPYWNTRINEAAGAATPPRQNATDRRDTNNWQRGSINTNPAAKPLANAPQPPDTNAWQRGYRPAGEGDLQAARLQGRNLLGNVTRGSELIGMPVFNRERTKLGEIKDLMVAMPSGQVKYAVLGSGGFLGLADKRIAVPLTDFTMSDDGESLLLYVEPSVIKNAKGLDRDNWPESADPNWKVSAKADVDTDPAGAEVKVKGDVDTKDVDDDDGAKASIKLSTDKD